MTGFWSSETMRSRLKGQRLVVPFDAARIANCSYELSMGPQALLTGTDQIRRDLAQDEQLRIPPGHFAQLMTEEKLHIPPDALGLISMKSQVKCLGLVNVSGFHVDPGFRGRLRFSVYNAGPSSVYISRGAPTFLIWFAALDTPTSDLYEGRGGRVSFTDQDTKHMEGDVFTPQVLADRMKDFEGTIDARVDKLERKIGWQHWIGRVVVAAVIGSLITLGAQWLFAESEPDASSDAPAAVRPQATS